MNAILRPFIVALTFALLVGCGSVPPSRPVASTGYSVAPGSAGTAATLLCAALLALPGEPGCCGTGEGASPSTCDNCCDVHYQSCTDTCAEIYQYDPVTNPSDPDLYPGYSLCADNCGDNYLSCTYSCNYCSMPF